MKRSDIGPFGVVVLVLVLLAQVAALGGLLRRTAGVTGRAPRSRPRSPRASR